MLRALGERIVRGPPEKNPASLRRVENYQQPVFKRVSARFPDRPGLSQERGAAATDRPGILLRCRARDVYLAAVDPGLDDSGPVHPGSRRPVPADSFRLPLTLLLLEFATCPEMLDFRSAFVARVEAQSKRGRCVR